MANIWVLLRCHSKVRFLQILSTHCILVQRQIVERLFFVQITSTFCEFYSKSSQDIINSGCTNQVQDSIKGALVGALVRPDLILDELNEATQHLVLVIDEVIINLAF